MSRKGLTRGIHEEAFMLERFKALVMFLCDLSKDKSEMKQCPVHPSLSLSHFPSPSLCHSQCFSSFFFSLATNQTHISLYTKDQGRQMKVIWRYLNSRHDFVSIEHDFLILAWSTGMSKAILNMKNNGWNAPHLKYNSH